MVSRESETRRLQPKGRRLVPLGHELVHLLGSDVLRGVLRRAVLCARHHACRRSATSITSCCGRTSWPRGRIRAPRARSSRSHDLGPFWLPTINTALLLTSGVTLTIAHHALRADHRSQAILWLAITIVLGVTFLGVQVYEYGHAYRDLNLKLTSGIYGSTFFMLTGFHGFHVRLGTTDAVGDLAASD